MHINCTNAIIIGTQFCTWKGGEDDPSASSATTSRARAEDIRIAKAAAQDVKKTKYEPGEKPKEPKDEDHQKKIDQLFGGIKGEGDAVVDCLKDLSTEFTNSVASLGRNAETPRTHDRRSYGEVTKIINDLLKEREMRVSAGMKTERVDQEIEKMDTQRDEIRSRLAAHESNTAQNLQEDMNAAAPNQGE